MIRTLPAPRDDIAFGIVGLVFATMLIAVAYVAVFQHAGEVCASSHQAMITTYVSYDGGKTLQPSFSWVDQCDRWEKTP